MCKRDTSGAQVRQKKMVPFRNDACKRERSLGGERVKSAHRDYDTGGQFTN